MGNEVKKGRKKTKSDDMSERYNSPFAKKLRELIKSKGITQQELSDGLDGTISRQTINKWSLGTTSPDIISAGKIADYFGVSTDYLLERSSTPISLESACEYTGIPSLSLEKLSIIWRNNDVVKNRTDGKMDYSILEWALSPLLQINTDVASVFAYIEAAVEEKDLRVKPEIQEWAQNQIHEIINKSVDYYRDELDRFIANCCLNEGFDSYESLQNCKQKSEYDVFMVNVDGKWEKRYIKKAGD